MASQRRITVIVDASSENRECLKRALVNFGITYSQEPETPNAPLKLYLPEYSAAALTVLHAINSRPEGFTGEIALQDSRSFKINEEGKRNLLDLTTTNESATKGSAATISMDG